MRDRSKRVVTTSVLKHGQNVSISAILKPAGPGVTMLGSIGHHDQQLSGVHVDWMLSPV
jgi:hypothetical protein